MPSQPVRYHDAWIRIIAAVIAAHIMVVYGEPETSLELILTWDYYPAFLSSFIIAFLLISYINWITRLLDKRYEWVLKPLRRTFLQILFGMAVPVLGAFLMAYVYFRVRGVDILKTSYLTYDLQHILLLLIILNAYYLAYYLYLKWSIETQLSRDQLKNSDSLLVGEMQLEHQPEVQPSLSNQAFKVTKGSATLDIFHADIYCFYRNGETNYLKTFSGNTFLIPASLDEVEQSLNSEHFFRANRQVIISYKAIKEIKPIEFGKLKVLLEPAFRSEIVISQRRAGTFKKWKDLNKSRAKETGL